MNRLIVKSLIALSTFVFGVIVFMNLAGWERRVFTSLPIIDKPDAIYVTLQPIEFYGWWEDVSGVPRVTSPDTPRDLNDYRKLTVWDINDRFSPARIDIVCRLENRGKQPVDLYVLATGDFLVAPFRKGVYHDDGALAHGSLTERQNIGQRTVSQLQPGEVREIRFDSFDLKSVANRYKLKEYGELWPWELLVRFNVVTTDNKRVAEEEARLRLIPSLIL